MIIIIINDTYCQDTPHPHELSYDVAADHETTIIRHESLLIRHSPSLIIIKIKLGSCSSTCSLVDDMQVLPRVAHMAAACAHLTIL